VNILWSVAEEIETNSGISSMLIINFKKKLITQFPFNILVARPKKINGFGFFAVILWSKK